MVTIDTIFEAREEKRASVLFFHGLDGDPYTTWGG
jgi:hypothetical protein